MKKKLFLLAAVCILAVKPFETDASAAEVSRQTAAGDLSSDKSRDIELPGGEPVEENAETKPEDDAASQESEAGQPEKDGEQIQPEKDAEIKPGKENEETKPEDKQYKTSLSLSLLLYKGDTASVGVRYFNSDVYHVASSDSSVVKVSKEGRIKALKCGKADVTAVLENDGRRDELVLHVHVKESSYAKISSHGEGAEKISRASQAGLEAYRELAPGGTLKLKVSQKPADSEIIFSSSDVSVAEADSKGTVTAKKKGACTIRILLNDGKNQAVYRVRLYVKDPQNLTVTNEQKDAFFNDSVMVGNSLGVGLASYCRQQYTGFLGNARHFSAGSFSLMNDMRSVTAASLHPAYNGVKYRVRDALRVMGAKKAFISFGMNDLNIYGVQGTADVYQQFVRELQQYNKELEVYIISQTPVRRASGRLENGCIREFNRLMEAYAKKSKDVYFIDIFPAFLDSAGLLASQYCSDGFCHLTNTGYDVWTGQMKQFAGKQIVKEIRAKDALATVKESHLKQDYQTARKMVKKMDFGELRTKYMRELDKVKGKLS